MFTDSHLSALHREHSLQSELREIRFLYNDAVKSNEKLQKQNVVLQNDGKRTKEPLTLDYECRMKELSEQVFVLQNKLELTEKERDTATDLKGRETSVSYLVFRRCRNSIVRVAFFKRLFHIRGGWVVGIIPRQCPKTTLLRKN